MKRILVTCLVAGGALLGQAAKADIIFTLDPFSSGPSPFVLGAYEWAYVVSINPSTPSTHLDTDSWAAIQDIPGYIPGFGYAYFDPFITSVEDILVTTDSPRFGSDGPEYDLELDLGPDDVYPTQDLGTLYFQSIYDPTGPLANGNVLWELYNDDDSGWTTGGGNIELAAVPEASTVVATSFLGLLGAGYIVRRRRQAAPVA